jgi:hypothetical protein
MKVNGVDVVPGEKILVIGMTKEEWKKLSWWQKVRNWRFFFKKDDEPNGVYVVTDTGAADKPFIAERTGP